jgi:hypothetical protein
VIALNVDMGRCVYCHSVVTKNEDQCYVCGDTVPQRIKGQVAVRSRPVSGWTNVIFLVSLAFTAYCFFGPYRLSLPVTITISCALLALRILAERVVNRSQP